MPLNIFAYTRVKFGDIAYEEAIQDEKYVYPDSKLIDWNMYISDCSDSSEIQRANDAITISDIAKDLVTRRQQIAEHQWRVKTGDPVLSKFETKNKDSREEQIIL
jgi:hypothetical protein